MPKVEETVEIDLRHLVTLMNYYWCAVSSNKIGELGHKTYEQTVIPIVRRSKVLITKDELQNLAYHMKQAVFEKLPVPHIDSRVQPYNKLLKKIADDIPEWFRETPTGEVVFTDEDDINELQT